VLGQCRELVHLNLGKNYIGASRGSTFAPTPRETERLAGVLAQCTALAHLNLNYNQLGEAGAERLLGVPGQCAALSHLDLSGNGIGAAAWHSARRWLTLISAGI